MARPRKVEALFLKAQRDQRLLADWMRVHHEELLQQLGVGRIDWRAAMVVIVNLKLTDQHGQVPSRDTVARTWARVRRSMLAQKTKTRVLKPGELAPGVHLMPSSAVSTSGPSHPALAICPARPRRKMPSSIDQGELAPEAPALTEQVQQDYSLMAQNVDGATEQIRDALARMTASRVPMPKRLS